MRHFPHVDIVLPDWVGVLIGERGEFSVVRVEADGAQRLWAFAADGRQIGMFRMEGEDHYGLDKESD